MKFLLFSLWFDDDFNPIYFFVMGNSILINDSRDVFHWFRSVVIVSKYRIQKNITSRTNHLYDILLSLLNLDRLGLYNATELIPYFISTFEIFY